MEEKQEFKIIKESFNQFPQGILISCESPTVRHLWGGIHSIVEDYICENKRYINKKDYIYLRDTLKFLEVILYKNTYRQDKIVEEENGQEDAQSNKEDQKS